MYAEMPLAELGGAATGGLQHLGEGDFLGSHLVILTVRAMPVALRPIDHTTTLWMPPGEQLRPRRATHHMRVGLGEAGSASACVQRGRSTLHFKPFWGRALRPPSLRGCSGPTTPGHPGRHRSSGVSGSGSNHAYRSSRFPKHERVSHAAGFRRMLRSRRLRLRRSQPQDPPASRRPSENTN